MERREVRQTLVALYPVLRRFATAVCPREEDPDDYVQEAFVRALLLRDLHDYDHLGPYLRRTIVNLAANGRRALTRRRLALRRLHASTPAESVGRYPSEVADLGRLDRITRAILYLVDVEDQPYREVAGLVGLSEEAARARASRGRRRLSAEISQEAKT